MATAVRTDRQTVDEFYANPNNPDNAELVHGEVVEVPPPEPAHAWVGRTIFLALHTYAAPRGLGDAMPDQTGYALPPRDDTVRIPDASFVRAGRLPKPFRRRKPLRIAPDLVAEVLSDSDTRAVLQKKLTDYRAAGVAIVWVVDMDARMVAVHTPGSPVGTVGEDGALDGGDVLPGLAIPVRDLFADVADE